MPTVYLAGPINGCTDAEARGWRDAACAELAPAWTILNPMDRDYRGHEAEHYVALVEDDLADIYASDVVLVNAERPTWGTAQEPVYAKQWGKRVVAFCADPNPSPWLRYHADVIVSDLAAALAVLARPTPPT
jgi:nucleoside 2-deoxyribosyltransferase